MLALSLDGSVGMARVISIPLPRLTGRTAPQAAPRTRDGDDPLGAARGVLLGCVLGLALWLPIGTLAWWLLA
jgi:hypothetical protein